MKIRRKVTAALMVAAGAAAGVVAVQTPAAAYPMACTIYSHPTGQVDGRMARCTAGNGQYRLVLRCNQGEIYNLPDFYVYGPWKSPSASDQSIASCFIGKTSGFYRASSVGVRA